ncbi:glycosyltransferase [Algoriphagus boritolerans]|uniref:glycosyltransferase n=1 Tax=Algoriphagus boritolerans TaxID=308111 RepID=UPI000ADE78D4
MVYSGIIDAIRNPIPLMEGMKAEFEKSGEQIEWTFVGKVSEQVQNYVKSDPWLITRIHFAGYVSHQEVFGFYAKADALVLILTDSKNAKGNIPGKLFEYLATGIPVLALGDPKGDSAQILADSGAGEVIAHTDLQGIRSRLRYLMGASSSKTSSGGLEKYSRKSLSFQLGKILDEHTLS